MSTSHICKLYACKYKYCQHHINVAMMFFFRSFTISRLSACSPFWFRICLDGPVFACANLGIYSCGWLLRKLLGLRRKYLTHYKYSYALLMLHHNIFCRPKQCCQSFAMHAQRNEIRYQIQFSILRSINCAVTKNIHYFSNHIIFHDILCNICS